MDELDDLLSKAETEEDQAHRTILMRQLRLHLDVLTEEQSERYRQLIAPNTRVVFNGNRCEPLGDNSPVFPVRFPADER